MRTKIEVPILVVHPLEVVRTRRISSRSKRVEFLAIALGKIGELLLHNREEMRLLAPD